MRRPVLINANPHILETTDGVLLTADQIHLNVCEEGGHIHLILDDQKGAPFAQVVLCEEGMRSLISELSNALDLIGAVSVGHEGLH